MLMHVAPGVSRRRECAATLIARLRAIKHDSPGIQAIPRTDSTFANAGVVMSDHLELICETSNLDQEASLYKKRPKHITFQEEVVVLPSAPLAPVSAIVSGSDYVPVTFTWLSP